MSDLRMDTLKLTQIGNSVGVILPKEVLAKLKVSKGDTLYLTDTPYGIALTPYDPSFEQQLEQGFLAVQPVLGFVPHTRLRPVDHLGCNLFAAVCRQAVQEDGRGLGQLHARGRDGEVEEDLVACASLALLAHAEQSAGEIAARFDMTKPSMSHHFAVLKEGRIRSITGFLDQVPAGV